VSKQSNTEEDFALANGAFDLFTLPERLRALEYFAGLRYPSLMDRFFEAVYRVITEREVTGTHG
jgi:hypothetical protein